MSLRRISGIAVLITIGVINCYLIYAGAEDLFYTLKQHDIYETEFINDLFQGTDADNEGYYKKFARMDVTDALKKPERKSVERGIRNAVNAINRNPGDEESWLILAELLIAADEILVSEKVFTLDDIDNEGSAALELSLECLLKANSLNPGAKEIVLQIAKLMLRFEKETEALAWIEQYFFLNPSVSWNRIPFDTGSHDQMEAALKGLERYIRTDSGYKRKIHWTFHPYTNAVMMVYLLDRKDKADGFIEMGANATPIYFRARYFYELGRLIESRGDLPKAMECYLRASEIDPEVQNVTKRIEMLKKSMPELDKK